MGVLKWLHQKGALAHISGSSEELRLACEYERIDVVRYLLKHFPIGLEDLRDPWDVDIPLFTSVICSTGNVELAKVFCNHFRLGKYRTVLSSGGQYAGALRRLCLDPFEAAGSRGDVGMCRFLLKTFQPCAAELRKRVAFVLDSLYSNEHVRMLRFFNQELNLLTRDNIRAGNNYLLRRAVAGKQLEMVKYLCTTFQLTVKDAQSENNEAIWAAIRNGDLEMVKYHHTSLGLTAHDVKAIDGGFAILDIVHAGLLHIIAYSLEEMELTGSMQHLCQHNQVMKWYLEHPQYCPTHLRWSHLVTGVIESLIHPSPLQTAVCVLSAAILIGLILNYFN